MNHRKSIPTIDNIEFVDLHPMDVNPLMSSCTIKVFYIGQNRNGNFIDKATATKMSKTLRGCPIVGHYVETKEDFGTHGDQMIIDDNGVKFNKLTRPYGFVATDAKVWFQFFEDTDEFGNTVVREYLCVTGYLWTGQFPESKVALNNCDPQSMELDPENLKGHWATDNNSGLEFFIINDAIFSALCILGEDVEPCFEGASILPNETSSLFSKDSEFTQELFKMIKELNYALNNKGGTSMNEEAKTPVIEENVTPSTEEEKNVENSFSEQGKTGKLNTSENENITEEFKKQEEEEKDSNEDKKNTSDSNSEDNKDTNKDEEKEEEEEKKPKTKNTLEENNVDFEALQKNFNELQVKFAALEKENQELIAFKNQIEEQQKDELIKSFYMLSEEDKKDIIANKANYSLSDIEKELSVICVRKRVNFNIDEEEEKTTPVTFNLDSHQTDNLPAWLQSVENIRNSNN